MTTVVVPADPPRPELVYPTLITETPLSPEAITDLYTATLSDVCRSVALSGGDLLVNYRPTDLLPEAGRRPETDPETELRSVLDEAIDVDIDDVRFEVQAGSTESARRGNTITHLLENEQPGSVAIIEPDAPLIFRTQVDSLAMALRRDDVILASGGDGTVAMSGFGTTIDFTDAYTPPALRTLTERAIDAGHDPDFTAGARRIQTPQDLRSVVVEIQARDRADRIVPPHTAATIESLGLTVTTTPDGLELSIE